MKQITKNNLIIFGLLPFILGLITSFSLPPYNLILINFITFPTLLFIVFELKKSNKITNKAVIPTASLILDKKKRKIIKLVINGYLVLDIFYLIFIGLHIL